LSEKFPFISIVTPSLNQATYIEQNIKSVLNQNYPNFEHIIIDGGSTDGTIDILRKYDHLIWVSEKDNGQSEAINKGFKRAKGEIIGWLNSDDYYEPGAFIIIVEELCKPEGKYVVVGDCKVVDGKGEKIGYCKAKLTHPSNFIKYWDRDYRIPQPAVFFYKDIIDRVGFLDEELQYVMDYDFWLRVSKYYQLHYIEKTLAVMRVHDRAKTSLSYELFEREWFKILRKYSLHRFSIDNSRYLLLALNFRSNLTRINAYSEKEVLPLREFRRKVLASIVVNPLNLFRRKFASALFRAIVGHHLSDLTKALFIRAENKLDYVRSNVARIIQKLFLRDFLQVLEKTENVVFTKKIQYVLREILSRVEKLIIRGLFITRFKESKKKVIGIAKTHGFEEVVCGLCGSPEYEVIGTRNGFNNVRCSNCGLRFITPRYSADCRKHFYSWKYNCAGYTLLSAFNNLDLAVSEQLIADQILRIISLYKKNGNLIEIGPFGRGLTREAEKKGFDCWLLKSSGWVYDFPVEKREYRGGNGELSLDGMRFDVVSCLDVLDRIPDPLRELKEINKIMKNDGILLIRVPDFSSTVAEQAGIAWDYNRPWERIYQFDYLRLKELLDKSGFKIIDLKTELSDGVGSPGCIIVVGMKKDWSIKKNNPRILIIREGAAGDVLLTTPIVKGLRRKLPDAHLVFMTKYPEILQNNPYVDDIVRYKPKDNVDVAFNLMYELYPDIPIIEAYRKITQLPLHLPEIEFYLSLDEQEGISRLLETFSIENGKGFVVIHPMVGNRMKSWDKNRFQAVSDHIRSRDLKVVTVGSPIDCVELRNVINLIGRLSLRQSAALISRAKAFVGLDSFPMHVANAFKIPSVILFGSTDPSKVLADGRNVEVVRSSEHCLGCRHDTTPDRWKQNVGCRRGKLYCMENISADCVIEKIDEMIQDQF